MVHFIGKLRYLLIVTLAALLCACLVLVWMTRDAMSQLPVAHPNALVDLKPWDTAQALASMAESAEESVYAREAEHLADHDVDQAFAAALRIATLHRPTLHNGALDLSRKVAGLQQVVAGDKANVRALTQSDPNGDLEIAKAQLQLDSDQLAEAQQDLARASGDERPRIQQELTAHEASMKRYDSESGTSNTTAVVASRAHNSVVSLVNAWMKERSRRQLLESAQGAAHAKVKELTRQHEQWEPPKTTTAAAGDKTVQLARINEESARSQLLGIYDDRIATERQLAALYGRWAEQVALQHRMTQHLLAQSFAWLLLIITCVAAIDVFARRLAGQPALDHRNARTLTTILRFSIFVVGGILAMVVLLGTPTQMPTILGLTTAGLTVVLQDFIIAFFGWFVLIGKNGIRVGDWVEINGVAGEVVAVGLLRTEMLETSNISSKGHPTGRRITFINSFAIKGQYFNFSTTGQWMWDEIRIAVPAGRDAYATTELIRKEVKEATAKDSLNAEKEWERVSRRFSTEPSVDMRPGSSGIDLVVRYVTRASERFDVRNRLYERLLRLLHQPSEKQIAG